MHRLSLFFNKTTYRCRCLRSLTLSLMWVIACIGAVAQVYVSGKGEVDADTLPGVMLQELTVRRGKEHYSKRNNPAVDFVNKIRSAKGIGNPRRHPYLNYRKYDKISFGINDFRPDSSDTKSKFAFLREHVDTSDISGLPVLPLSIKEKVTEVVYRQEPEAEKQIVIALQQDGVDEFADFSNMQTMLEDVFREVDLYEDNITLMRNEFVSPLSKIGPDFYKYYLTDTAMVDGVKCVVLSFAPRNPATFGFLGRLYVEEGDSTMFVKKVDMGVSPTINLNFVERLKLRQNFKKHPDGTRLKTLDDLNVEFSIIGAAPAIYGRRTTSYDSYSFDRSDLYDEMLDKTGDVFQAEDALLQDSIFWSGQRQIKQSYNEGRMEELMRKLRSVPLYRWGETALRIFVKGYVSTSKTDSKFDIGPLNTFISYNSTEGVRLRGGGLTTANFSDRWFARGYIAYGFRDRRLKYNAEVEHSFNRKRYHATEFPVHSITLQERYDIDQLGQHYRSTNADNMFLSLKRGNNHLTGYRRDSRLRYKLELRNNLSISVDAGHMRMEHGPWMKFILPDKSEIDHYNQLLFTATLRYAPGEKFLQTASMRLPVNRDAPEFILTHTFAPKGVAGARWGVNRTELTARKRFWLSAFGYLDVAARVGHLWGKSAFPDLMSPDANLSYTIQRESFSLLNPLEFIGDTYGEWFITYWANGLLFNQIPYLKRLKLREVIGFRGWIGRLSNRNRPWEQQSGGELPLFPEDAHAADMHGKPYMELSAGLDNILRIMRLDFIWRLSYSDNPNADRFGIRLALHFTF